MASDLTNNVIGVGSTGCVIEHPIECVDSKSKPLSNVVSKIAPKENIKEELEKSEIVDTIDPRNIFTIEYRGACLPKMNTGRIIEMLKEKSCSPKIFKKKSKEKLYQLLMDYGGVAIDDLSPELKIKYPSAKRMIPIVLTEVLRMMYGIYTLRSLHLSHYDIHSSNVLLNPDTMRLYLIDFGMMIDDKNIWSQFMRHNFMPRDYSHYPPELLILIWLIKYKPRLLIIFFEGLPDTLASVITDGTRRENSSELRYALQRINDGLYLELGEFLLPENFPDDSRYNLYQIRCAGLIAIYRILKTLPSSLTKKQKLEKVLAQSIMTMDSYALGSVLLKYLSYMMIQKPLLSKDPYIKRVIELLEKLKNERLDERVDIQEGIGEMINLFKESRSSESDRLIDLRKEVKIGELLRSLQHLGIY
jgi:hypothetical protein